MYDSFYGFRERPFTLLPDPDFLFLDKKHQAALNMLETAVADRSGFCVISGEIGAGKTTLIRELLNRLDDTVCVGLVSNTHPAFGELLQWIMAAYGLPCGDADTLELHKHFIEFVVQQYAQNRHTLLIIDEAQNLSVQALEELRMLSNVNSEQDAILQVVLVGQHQLRDRLLQPELAQFSQRIALNYHLEALDQDETCRYIQHRVAHAGGAPGLFSADACQAVFRLSGGVPRLINRLCDLSLVYGCTAESRYINAELVHRVGAEQRMSALQDIPEVKRATAQLVEAPSPDTEKSSVDTIVGEAHSALVVGEEETAGHGAAKKAPATPAESELHQLVVNAEQLKKRTRGERGALWLLLIIVAMAGGTGWLIGDFQSGSQTGISGNALDKAASSGSIPATMAEDSTAAVVIDTGLDTEKNENDAALAKEAQAKRLEQQRVVELKREADRLERERLAEEQRLVKQREARETDRKKNGHEARFFK